jgi:DNA-binding transcriptional regulator YiaG
MPPQSSAGRILWVKLPENPVLSFGKIELRTSALNVSHVCETISPDEIKASRKDLGMTQDMFAVVPGVSENTVESWETGKYAPDGSARRP